MSAALGNGAMNFAAFSRGNGVIHRPSRNQLLALAIRLRRVYRM
jgi:hypothetical protein